MNKKYEYVLSTQYRNNNRDIINKKVIVYNDSIITCDGDYAPIMYLHFDGKIKKIKSFINTMYYKGHSTYVLLDNGNLLYCATDDIPRVIATQVSDFAYIEISHDNIDIFIKYNDDTVKTYSNNNINVSDVKYIFNNVIYLKNNDIIVYKYNKPKKFNVENVKQLVLAGNTLFVLTNDKKLLMYDIDNNTCKSSINAKYIVGASCLTKMMIISDDNILYTYNCYDSNNPIIESCNINNVRECGFFERKDYILDDGSTVLHQLFMYVITNNNELYCSGGKQYGESFVKVKDNVKEVCGWYDEEFCYVETNGNMPVDAYINGSKYLINSADFDRLINNKSNNISANQMVIYLKDDNTIMTCGNNQFGQLGLGDTNDRNVLTKVPNINDVKQVCCSDEHSMILFNDGTIATCGNNRFGQLGLGNNENKNTFTKVPGIKDVKQISCGGNSSMIKLTNGDVMTCGDNTVGQLCLGDNKNRNIFTKVTI